MDMIQSPGLGLVPPAIGKHMGPMAEPVLAKPAERTHIRHPVVRL